MMMTCPLVLLLTLGLATAATSSRQEFNNFKARFGKEYATPQEEEFRFRVFQKNLVKTARENQRGLPYTTGVTQFSDLTHQEFKDNYLGLKHVPLHHTRNSTVRVSKALPDYVNWAEKGVVTAVKNQGQCGSCWAFATTEQVESYAMINSGELPDLSAQQVTACTPNTLQCGGSGGCQGSVTQLAFSYLQLWGQMEEGDYPYTSGTTSQAGACTHDPTKTRVTLSGYDTLPSNNHDAVMTHIAEVGPLAIAVDASQWHSYTGGIFNGCSFEENISINHGVQLVGYGSDFSPAGVYDYWLVRNSWGPAWGEEGYIRLQRTPSCGVNSTPMDGTACAGGPGNDEQTVCGMCGMLLDASYPLGVKTV